MNIILLLIIGIAQPCYAQTNYFQGKLMYKITVENGIEEGFPWMQSAKEQIGSIDSIVVYIRDDYYRVELHQNEVIQYFQYIPSVNLIYEFRTNFNYVFIYPPDYELFPVLNEGQTITHDSTITRINGFSCKSYTVGSDLEVTTNYYSDSLQSKLPVLSNQYGKTLQNFENPNLISIKTVNIFPDCVITQELVDIKRYEVPMNTFQLPNIGKKHKKMMKEMGIEVRKIKK